MESLKLKDLSVMVGGKKILEKINLEIKSGEVVVLMGPNGAGKSTIFNAIAGNPNYKIINGEINLSNENITDTQPEERAKKGLFLSFQNPVEIDGVTMTSFLRSAYNSIKGKNVNVIEFQKLIKEKMAFLEMDSKFRVRSINKGFSGGEKKRSEILQMLLFEPKFALLDEIDSGLDVDALKIVSKGIEKVKNESNTGILIITHYNKILDYVKPNRVYILKKGEIVESGDGEIAKRIENRGFE